MERELTHEVDLCLPGGILNPDAVGWSRHPVHDTRLPGWGRNKRFEFWSVATPGFIVTLNISHHDYRANIGVSFTDRATFTEVRQGGNRWLPRADSLRGAPDEPMEARGKDILVRLTPNADGTHLHAESPRIRIDLQAIEEPGHESMGVVVPWSRRRFQYTKKDNCLPVEGTVIVDGATHVVRRSDAFGTHDRGRGRWPYLTKWNWGSGSGCSAGRRIGVQVGGKWTDGTPSTENWLRVDGRLHKISEHLDWSYDPADWMSPWRITSRSVDIVFRPIHHGHHEFNRWVVLSRGDTCFGHFSGSVALESGGHVEFEGIFGHVEEVTRRW